jgi:hypothetical protein
MRVNQILSRPWPGREIWLLLLDPSAYARFSLAFVLYLTTVSSRIDRTNSHAAVLANDYVETAVCTLMKGACMPAIQL